jgi:peroxiredoxin Q/BCP
MLKENSFAPDFNLIDQEGRMHSLADYKGNWVLIYFYPKDFTPNCTAEACFIRDALADFKEMHINVVGINNDSQESHKKFAEKHKLSFPLLADPKMETIKAYKANFLFLTWRISYLISPKGVVRKAYGFVNPSSHPGEVIEDVKKFLEVV